MTIKNLEAIIQAILSAIINAETKRAYRRALGDFRAWYEAHGAGELKKSVILAYILDLSGKGMSARNINLHLICVRRLAAEACDSGELDPAMAAGIMRVRGMEARGQRLGNWLTKDQANALLKAPDVSTLKGKRDKAILAVLLDSGIRREEAASLTFEQIQRREGRWVIVDLVGKRNKIRSIPMSTWCKAAIDEWSQAAGISTGLVFRSMRRGNHLGVENMIAQTIFEVVTKYAQKLGLKDLAPHDCRRTFAKLAHQGGSSIEQIQYSLGHESIVVTQKYIGTWQSMTDAPCDHLGIGV